MIAPSTAPGVPPTLALYSIGYDYGRRQGQAPLVVLSEQNQTLLDYLAAGWSAATAELAVNNFLVTPIETREWN